MPWRGLASYRPVTTQRSSTCGPGECGDHPRAAGKSGATSPPPVAGPPTGFDAQRGGRLMVMTAGGACADTSPMPLGDHVDWQLRRLCRAVGLKGFQDLYAGLMRELL